MGCSTPWSRRTCRQRFACPCAHAMGRALICDRSVRMFASSAASVSSTRSSAEFPPAPEVERRAGYDAASTGDSSHLGGDQFDLWDDER